MRRRGINWEGINWEAFKKLSRHTNLVRHRRHNRCWTDKAINSRVLLRVHSGQSLPAHSEVDKQQQSCHARYSRQIAWKKELFLAENDHSVKTDELKWHPVSDCFQNPCMDKLDSLKPTGVPPRHRKPYEARKSLECWFWSSSSCCRKSKKKVA